ncbi:MAG: hypothetical protein KAR79_05785 [Simkaniaceae bacterium]|nr:hypothetical protein [Simkaniaceae bacterium]
MERIFLHFLREARANLDRVIVLPGFGLGAFMTPALLGDAKACFVRALNRAIEAEGHHFDKIIFADPNTNLTSSVSSISGVITTNKSCLDVAHFGAKKGLKIALFNPGDGSGIPGQFWLNGHIALEEMFGLFTTLLLAQHPHCNENVSRRERYVRA